MTTRTTTNLHLSLLDWLRWHRARLLWAVVAIGWLLAALGARSLLLAPPVQPGGTLPTPALPTLAVATNAPMYIIATARPQPPTPTPDTRVLEELAALREQVARLQAAQPVYVDRVVYVNQPIEAAPTPEPEQYTTASEPPDDFYTTPPHVDPAAQQALVGDDPDSLACGGSPLCFGMTNAEAQAALDRQKEQP